MFNRWWCGLRNGARAVVRSLSADRWRRVFLAGLMLAVITAFSLGNTMGGRQVLYDTDVIAAQITEITELATLKYKYRNAAKSEEDPYKLFNAINIPFTGKSMIVSYEGVMKLGTDLSGAKVEIRREKKKEIIRVTLEHCEILSHEIDEHSWEFWDMTSYVFNPLTPEDDSNLRKEQKGVMEERVRESGLLEEADEKAVNQVKTLLGMIYPEAVVEVIFGK